jgi:hypothetical protein
MYYLNAFELRRRAMQGLVAGCAYSPLPSGPVSGKVYQAELEVFHPTAAMSTSTTPTGFIQILLASGGNFLLPIVLSIAQLAISRQWPGSAIPRNLEQIKVIVNVVGASATSLVAALNRWRLSRITCMLAAAEEEAEATVMVRRAAVGATETTALLGSQNGARLKRKTSKEPQVGVKFGAELIGDIDVAEDQTQGFATSLPVTYPSASFPDAGFCFSCVNVYDRLP